MPITTKTLLAGLALVGTLTLSACGDTTSDEDTASTPSPSADGGTPTGDAAECAGDAGDTVTVEIGDFVFEPATVSVSACDEIVWSNVHDQPHTSTGTGDVDWSTGNLAPGDDADSIVFDTPGTFSYICALHPFMKGTVEVS